MKTKSSAGGVGGSARRSTHAPSVARAAMLFFKDLPEEEIIAELSKIKHVLRLPETKTDFIPTGGRTTITLDGKQKRVWLVRPVERPFLLRDLIVPYDPDRDHPHVVK